MNFKAQTRFYKRLRRLKEEREGSVLIEFAFVVPILILLFMPLYDFYNYLVTEQRVIKTGWTVADMIAMSASQQTIDDEPVIPDSMLLSTQSLNNIMQTAHFLMAPSDLTDEAANFGIRISSIQKLPDDTVVTHWTRRYDGAAINNPATAVELPANFANDMQRGENVIAVQTAYTVRPIFNLGALGIGALAEKRIIKRHYFPVRQGSLSTIAP